MRGENRLNSLKSEFIHKNNRSRLDEDVVLGRHSYRKDRTGLARAAFMV